MILRPYCLVLLFANIYAKAADTTLRGPTAARAPKEAGAVATGNYQNLFVTQLKLKVVPTIVSSLQGFNLYFILSLTDHCSRLDFRDILDRIYG